MWFNVSIHLCLFFFFLSPFQQQQQLNKKWIQKGNKQKKKKKDRRRYKQTGCRWLVFVELSTHFKKKRKDLISYKPILHVHTCILYLYVFQYLYFSLCMKNKKEWQKKRRKVVLFWRQKKRNRIKRWTQITPTLKHTQHTAILLP